MKRILYAAAILGFLTACESATDPIDGIGGPGPGGGAVTQAQVTGNWSFVLDRTSATCSAGSLPDNQVILAHLEPGSTGTLITTTSNWQAPPPATFRGLEGGVNLTNGSAILTLRGSTTNTGMDLRGTFTATGNFVGTLQDPRAGFLPVFGTAVCAYAATGVKV